VIVTYRVSSGAASKRVVTSGLVCAGATGVWAARANLTRRFPLVRLQAGPRPALSGRGAIAARVRPPHSRERETGLAGLALSAGEVPAGVAPSRKSRSIPFPGKP